jgi:hypothetical protein
VFFHLFVFLFFALLPLGNKGKAFDLSVAVFASLTASFVLQVNLIDCYASVSSGSAVSCFAVGV